MVFCILCASNSWGASGAAIQDGNASVQAPLPSGDDANGQMNIPPAPSWEDVAPENITKVIAETKGLLILHLTSYDPDCNYCLNSNPRFETFAQRHGGAARYVRVSWDPWQKFSTTKFMGDYRVGGLPAHLAFRDGHLMQRVIGDVSLGTLEKLFSTDTDKTVVAENMTPAQFEKLVAEQNKEWKASEYGKKRGFIATSLVVQFSSQDPHCPQCQAANADFDELASIAAGTPERFVRVLWGRWQDAANYSQIKRFNIGGLPVILKYKMGAPRGRLEGLYPVVQAVGWLGLSSSGEIEFSYGASDSGWMRFKKAK
jgi:hypothetical protein